MLIITNQFIKKMGFDSGGNMAAGNRWFISMGDGNI